MRSIVTRPSLTINAVKQVYDDDAAQTKPMTNEKK